VKENRIKKREEILSLFLIQRLRFAGVADDEERESSVIDGPPNEL